MKPLSNTLKILSENIVATLQNQNKTLALAESCTGGLLASSITRIPGISNIFLGAIVSYSNSSKISLLNVQSEAIESFGAVSQVVAGQMAQNARKKFSSDFALSITGIAGPSGGSIQKPVGYVCFGLADAHRVYTSEQFFGNQDRINIQILSCIHALTCLSQIL